MVAAGDENAPGTRNTERTRRALLDATRRLLAERGGGLTLAMIADAAGVSKSGLLHHFTNRDALLLAALEDANDRFRSDVMQHLDLSENTPGKLLRAYVRALADTDSEAAEMFGAASFWIGIQSIPGGTEIMAEDGRRWQRDLAADGLDEDVVRLVQRAIEGLAAAYCSGEESDASLKRTAAQLIQLTLNPPALST